MRAGQPAPVRLLAGSGARRPGSLPGSGHGKLLVNVLFMGLTTTARLLTNVVLFVLLARAWPVDQFGEFVYWFTAATIVALIVDFGFSQSLLRDIGRDRDRAGDFVREVSLAKAVLAGLVGIGALAAFAVGAWDMHTTMLFLMLLAGAMLATFGESLNATWRGVGNFAEETRVVVLSSVVLFGVVAVSLALGAGPLQVAGGMLLARLAYVAISWPVLRALPAPGFTPSLARSLRLIRDYQLDIPAILMTAHGSERIAVEAFRLGARNYLSKPS